MSWRSGWRCARREAADTEALRSAALGVLFVSAACCVYYYLLPDGKISGTAKRVLAVFFLASVLSPLFSLLNGGAVFSFGDVTTETQAPAALGPLVAAAEAAFRAAADETIRAYTDVGYEIRIVSHITADNCIDMEQMTVIFEREFDGREKLAAALRESLGAAVETEVRDAVEKDPRDAGAAAEG